LKTTVLEGGTQIEINDVPGDKNFDWAVDEQIVIASTDFEGRHAEQRKITSIGGTTLNPILYFDEPLEYQHYAGSETHGQHVLEMRAEVGLLSRNVVFRGDPETSKAMQYGAHIMLANGQS
jgi:cell migration-inducing and hyaluronan-binding protein